MADRYEILEVIGRGSMGSVHKAHDRVLDETVAIKVLRPHFARTPEIAQRFRSEIKLARRVRHPNVCAIHEYGETDGVRYISMEFVDGMNLRRKIQAGAGPPTRRGLRPRASRSWAASRRCTTPASSTATSRPRTSWSTATGRVRLMDFGLAKQRSAAEGAAATAIGQVMGTPEFMSPEQVRGERADFPSDIYAMGIVFYEMFTGEVPFKGSAAETMINHVHKLVPFDGPVGSRIPDPLVMVLQQALAKAPADRYATARGMATAIRHAAALGEASAPAAAPTAPAVRFGSRAGPARGYSCAPRPRPRCSRSPRWRRSPPAGFAVPGADGSRGPDLQVEVQSLISSLRDADPSARRRAAQALGECGPDGARSGGAAHHCPQRSRLLGQRDRGPRLAQDHRRARPRRRDGGAGTRRAGSDPARGGAAAPGHPGPGLPLDGGRRPRPDGAPAHEAIPALIEALEDEELAVRWDAAKALGKMGAVAARAVPALTAVLHEQDDASRAGTW